MDSIQIQSNCNSNGDYDFNPQALRSQCLKALTLRPKGLQGQGLQSPDLHALRDAGLKDLGLQASRKVKTKLNVNSEVNFTPNSVFMQSSLIESEFCFNLIANPFSL